MTTATTYTARNLDADVGDVLIIDDGQFMIAPWAYKMPTTSGRFELSGVPSGVYTITAKNPDTQEDGAGVKYILTAKP